MRTLDRKTICRIQKWYTDAMAELSAEYNAKWEQADGNVDAIKAANAWHLEQEDKLNVEYGERVERALDEASEKPAPAEREENGMKVKDVIKHVARITDGDIRIKGETGAERRFTFDDINEAIAAGAPFANKKVGIIYVDGSDIVITCYE